MMAKEDRSLVCELHLSQEALSSEDTLWHLSEALLDIYHDLATIYWQTPIYILPIPALMSSV